MDRRWGSDGLRRLGFGRVFVALIVAALLVVAWRSPSPTWACGLLDRSSRCEHMARLRPVNLGFDPSFEPGDAALSPDGSEIAVALRSPGPNPAGETLSALLVFDVETGAQVRPLLAVDDGLVVFAPHYSTDGSQVAVLVATAQDDVVEGGSVLVLDAASGDVLERVGAWTDPESVEAFRWDDCRNFELSMSVDGQAVSCGFDGFLRSDGSPIKSHAYGEFNALMVRRSLAWGRLPFDPEFTEPLQVAFDRDRQAIELGLGLANTREIPHSDPGPWRGALIGLSGNGEQLVVARRIDAPWWRDLGPRVVRPGGDLVLVDLADDEVVDRIALARRPRTGAWAPDASRFVVLDDDLVLTVIRAESAG